MQIKEEDNIYKTNFPDLEPTPKIGSFKYFLGWVIDKFSHIVEKYYYAKFSLKRKNVEIELLKKEVDSKNKESEEIIKNIKKLDTELNNKNEELSKFENSLDELLNELLEIKKIILK